MKSISTLVLASAIFGAASVMGQGTTSEGCFSSTTGMTLNGTLTFNSKGSCGQNCFDANYAVFAMQHFECYCGQNLPPAASSVDASACTISCPGYPDDICGSANDYSVYLTGLTTSASNIDLNSASPSTSATATAGASTGKPSSTSTAKPSVVTVGGQTVVVTAASESSNVSNKSSSSSGSSGPNKAAIAAGVVVGIVVFAAVGGALVIFLRNRRRRAIEEEHQRQAAVNNFINEGKRAGGSSAGSFPDMRLDPAVMAQRRMSDGSIADNQDYSRRILKVTNA